MLDMLKKYGMMACKPVATPIEQIAKLRVDVGEVLEDPQCTEKLLGVSSTQHSRGQTCRMM